MSPPLPFPCGLGFCSGGAAVPGPVSRAGCLSWGGCRFPGGLAPEFVRDLTACEQIAARRATKPSAGGGDSSGRGGVLRTPPTSGGTRRGPSALLSTALTGRALQRAVASRVPILTARAGPAALPGGLGAGHGCLQAGVGGPAHTAPPDRNTHMQLARLACATPRDPGDPQRHRGA